MCDSREMPQQAQCLRPRIRITAGLGSGPERRGTNMQVPPVRPLAVSGVSAARAQPKATPPPPLPRKAEIWRHRTQAQSASQGGNPTAAGASPTKLWENNFQYEVQGRCLYWSFVFTSSACLCHRRPFPSRLLQRLPAGSFGPAPIWDPVVGGVACLPEQRVNPYWGLGSSVKTNTQFYIR